MGQTTHEKIEALPLPSGAVRISAAHLVTSVRADNDIAAHQIAMLSVGAHKKGFRRFDALGGAIALGELGLSYIERFSAGKPAYDAQDKTHDARFIVPNETARDVLRWFSDLSNHSASELNDVFEGGPQREVYEELTGNELAGYVAVVPPFHPGWLDVYYEYLGVAIQPPPVSGVGTSVNETDIPTRRLFHGWRMVAPVGIVVRILHAEQIKMLGQEDLASTKGGSQKGVLADGTPLGDNLGLEYSLL